MKSYSACVRIKPASLAAIVLALSTTGVLAAPRALAQVGRANVGRRRHGRDRRTAAWCHGHGDEHSERDFAGAHHRGGGPLPGSGAAARAVRHPCRALWICAGPTVPDPVGRSRCDHRFPAHGRGAAGERDRHRRGAGHRGFEVPAVLDRRARAVADPAEPRSQLPVAGPDDARRRSQLQPKASVSRG